jgi:hypothetical protein
MRKSLLLVLLAGLWLPRGATGQDGSTTLADFSRVITSDGLDLTLVHLNEQTVPTLFKPPTFYSMRLHARETTMLFVQGTPQKDVQLTVTNFTIEQGAESIPSKPSNVRNFQNGLARSGERVDGVLTFAKLVDISKAFSVWHGQDTVEFRFTADQVKAARSISPPQ